jgi:hypothetical protein
MRGTPLVICGALALLALASGCGEESTSPVSAPDVAAPAPPSSGDSGTQVKANVGIPGHFFLEAETEGCENNPGPQISLNGELTLGGLDGKLIFRNNRQGTHEAEEDVTASIVLLEEGESITFAKQPPLGGVGGNPWISLEMTDGAFKPISDEVPLGRCVQGLMTSSMDLLFGALAQCDVTTADCSNSGGPTITIDGDLRLGGLNANLIFRNNAKGTHEREEETEVSIVIVPNDSEISIPKPPPLGGAAGNPYIFFVFTDGAGNAVSDEFYLGRCVQMSK